MDCTSLEGKVFLVTGASSGLGKETVRRLVRRDATVIMASRSLGGIHLAIKDISSKKDMGIKAELVTCTIFESFAVPTMIVL